MRFRPAASALMAEGRYPRFLPASLARREDLCDARDHGVEIRPVCINASRWDCTLEPIADDRFAVRLGFRHVRGLANKDGAEIVTPRADRPFESVDDLWRRADVRSLRSSSWPRPTR